MTLDIVSGLDLLVSAGRPVDSLKAADVDKHLPFAAVDSEQLLRQCDGNMNFVTFLLNVFEQSCESRRAKFNGALIEDRNDVIAREAHAHKGVAEILAAKNADKSMHGTAVCR